MKKIIVISTSLRHGSNSNMLAEKFIEGAKAAGNEVEKISLVGQNIQFCKGCMACQKQGRCVIKDDVNDIMAKVLKADVICWATPIYYYEMSGQMKTLIDRMNAMYEQDYQFRDVYLLTTAAEDEAETPKRAETGLTGWIDCYPKSRLAGTLFCGGVNEDMEYKTLNNGLKMPMVGLGVYNISERETQRAVEDAISVGYRSIDTAAMYYNEKGVGDAVRACGVLREDLFITTKICDSCFTKEETLRSVDHSMKLLGLDYVDLMLIHWPVGNPTVMWHTLEELYRQGMFKAIGISNFYPNTFPKIVEDAKVIPVVNQCETHVLYQQRKMLEYLKPYDTAMEAWSPLAEGKHGIFKNPTLVAIGEKYGKTSAQIALKFLVQNGIIVIPKTTHKERMNENIDLFDFTLSDDDLQAIQRLDTGRNVTGWPSDALKYEV